MVELLFFLYCHMEGFAEYESLKQHAAWQRKLRLAVHILNLSKISRRIYHREFVKRGIRNSGITE